ncbi:hypothetical protein [Hyphococcus sp.]|jgi:hypothetical protein|uniref:hypothetical protein n=1 Tax=Hyphococcus sp. TaxID=2038636 RepID=UPI003D12E436
MNGKNLAIGVLAALLGACATTGTQSGSRSDNNAAVDLASEAAGAQGLRPLTDAALPGKACGMVLWTLEGARPAAVFRFVSDKKAEINIAGKPVTLTRSAYDGAAGFGIFERQTFTSEEGVTVDVSARFGLGFEGGAYLENGLIKVRDANGWSMVAPTAGIAGCKN